MMLSFQILGLGCAAVLAAAVTPVFAQGSNSGEFSAFQIINERNIFDPNRRPRIQSAPIRQAPRVVDTFGLVGTMSYSGKLLAFFDGSDSDYRKSVKVGDRIATYTIKDIAHNTVTLSGGTNDVSLKIGMQMRRMEDGSWTPAEAVYGSSGGFGGNNRFSGGFSRGNRGGFRGFGQDNNNNNNNFNSGASNVETTVSNPDPSNLDPNDPVARLMLRRMEEEGRLPAQGNQPQPNQESQGNPAQNLQPQRLEQSGGGNPQRGQFQGGTAPGMEFLPASEIATPTAVNPAGELPLRMGGGGQGGNPAFPETNQQEQPSFEENPDQQPPGGGQDLRN